MMTLHSAKGSSSRPSSWPASKRAFPALAIA